MEKQPIIYGTIILATLLTSMYYITSVENTYECKSKGVISMCEKLSSTGTRCYYNVTRYYICPEGWEKFKSSIELNNTIEKVNQTDIMEKWRCSVSGCTRLNS